MEGDQGYGLHPLAAQDILNIWEYIAADSPIHASRLREELSDAMRSLVISPHSGYRRRSLTSGPLRFKLVREYVIAYAPEKKPLWIVAVFHGRRAPQVIAEMLKNREQ